MYLKKTSLQNVRMGKGWMTEQGNNNNRLKEKNKNTQKNSKTTCKLAV